MMNRKNVKEKLFLLVALALITVFSSFYIKQKSGYYVDEGMTLYLSNGVYTGAVTTVPDATLPDFVREYVLRDSFSSTVSNVRTMIDQVLHAGDYSKEGAVEWYDAARKVLQGHNTWMDGSVLFDMCTASKDDRFDYMQVYINQALDVHPCLYYILVHTVFSLFPGVYSVYFLFGVNMVCLLITCILMYSFIKARTSWQAALMGTLVYGFSQGFVSCAVFFRMYALETLAVFVTFYFYMTLKEKRYALERKDYIRLGLVAIFGFNVHYYYILYLIPLFALTMYNIKKEAGEPGKYFASQFVAGIVSLIIWPFSLYHILFGYRGTEAVSKLKSLGILKSALDYLILCARSLFFSDFAGGVVLVIAIASLIYGRKKADKNVPWKELLIPPVIYLIIVSKIAPSSSSRYIMCLFPFVIIALVCMIYPGMMRFMKDEGRAGYVCALLAVIYVVCSFVFIEPEFLYREKVGLKLGADIDRQKTDCLMITPEHYIGYVYMTGLYDLDQVMVLDYDMLDTLIDTRPRDEKEDILLYIGTVLDEDDILKSLKNYDFLKDRKTEKIESDLIDFDAYLMKVQ